MRFQSWSRPRMSGVRAWLAPMLVFMLAGSRALVGQTGAVEVLVIDDATDAVLPAVRVTIAGQSHEGLTDERGKFLYASARPGRVAFVLRRLGYAPGSMMLDVVSGDTARVTFALTTAAQPLATVSVRDTIASVSPFLNGFERRMRAHAGSATYITRSDIERLHPNAVTDLVNRVSSVTFNEKTGAVVSRRVQRPVLKGRAGSFFLDMADCPLRIAVDGQLKESGFPLNSLAPEEIHGIEIFPGPSTIPAEYASMQRDAVCGLIAIWTRRDK